MPHFLIVFDLHECQALGRRRGPGQVPVAGEKEVLHREGVALALADLDQGADQDADHIHKEPLADEFDVDLILRLADMDREETRGQTY